MKPSKGRIIIIKGFDSNGSDEQAAIVTGIDKDAIDPANNTESSFCHVNITVFPDCGTPQCRASVPFFNTREAAITSGHNPVAYWPDREPIEHNGAGQSRN